MEMIIIILVVIGLFSAYRELNTRERAIARDSIANTIKVASGYTYTAAKDTVKMASKSGTYVGASIALNQQETLSSLATFNADMTKNGAIRTGVKVAKEHAETLGVAGINKYLSEANDKTLAELAKLRKATADISPEVETA